MQEEKRNNLLKLMDQKDKIENEIEELTEILTKNGVGMQEPLVDSEGYPLNTIDVYQVRNARHMIICKQNDHKNLMKQIENGLSDYYSTCSASANNSQENLESVTKRFEKTILREPFAKIGAVTEGSPSHRAGLQEDDLLIEFGSVNYQNFKSLNDVGTIVFHSEGTPINVKIKRQDHYETFNLIPRKWTGKGLLGCVILSLQ